MLESKNMKNLLFVGAVGVAVFAFVAIAKAQDVGFEGVFDSSVSVDLKVNRQDGPVEVEKGDKIAVSWISEGASRCRGNWSKNDIKLSGTVAGRISRSAVIKVACINKEGERDDDSVVVNVSGQATVTAPIPVTQTEIQVSPAMNSTMENIASGTAVRTTHITLKSSGKPLQKIEGFVLELTGTAPRNAFAGVVIFPENSNYSTTVAPIPSGPIVPIPFNTNNQAVALYSGFIPDEGQVFTFGVVMAPNISQYDCKEFSVRVVAIRTSASVSGSLPISGGRFTIYSSAPATSAQPSITVLSPNGGESWQTGSTQTISWRGASAGYKFVLNLLGPDGYFSVGLGQEIFSPGITNYQWRIPEAQRTGNNKLQIGLCPQSNSDLYCSNMQKNTYAALDESDSYFTITAPASPITVDLKAYTNNSIPSDGPITVAAGTAIALSYTTTGKIEQCNGDVTGPSLGM